MLDKVTDDLAIALVSEADIDALLSVEAAATDYPWARQSMLDSLQGKHACYCFRKEEQLVGFAIMSQVLDEVELLNVAVLPAVQGQGIAKQLLVHALGLAFQQGAATCMLEVRAGNRRAIALYHGLGFYEVGHRPNYYPAKGGREDALLMCLPLPHYDENE